MTCRHVPAPHQLPDAGQLHRGRIMTRRVREGGAGFGRERQSYTAKRDDMPRMNLSWQVIGKEATMMWGIRKIGLG